MKILKYGLLALLFFLLGLVIMRIQVRQQDYELSIKGKLFVVNKLDKSISVFDLNNGVLLKQIDLQIRPSDIALFQEGKSIAIANYGNEYLPGKSISILDTKTYHIRKKISLPDATFPASIRSTQFDNKLLVTTNDQNKVFVIDAKNERITSSMSTNLRVCQMVAVHPYEPLAYITHLKSGAVCVLNYESNEIITLIDTGVSAEGIDITPDGLEVWASNIDDNTISIIDTKSNKVIESINVGRESYRLKFTNDGKRCFVTSASEGTIRIIDRFTKKELKIIQLPGKGNILNKFLYHTPRPLSIEMHPNGRFAFISNANANKIEIVDIEESELVGNINTARYPDAMVILIDSK